MPKKALSRILEPPEGWRPKQAGVIDIRQFYTLLDRLDLKDVDPVLVLRNQCILMQTWASAFRAKSCAKWLVREALYPNGQLVSMTRIRSDGTKGDSSVIVPVVVRQQREMLERWIDMRLEHGIMVSSKKEYRGLLPDSPMFPRWYAGAWGHWSPTRKTTKGKQYLVYTNIQTMISKFYQNHGYPACSSHSGRRGNTDAMRRRGIDRTTIQGVLGHALESSQEVYSDLDLAVFDNACRNLYQTKNPIKVTKKR